MGVGGGGGGAGSQESGAGSPLHEVCRQREWGDVGALGREKRVSPRQREAREAGVESPAAANYSAREEGTDGAATLGEESLQR